MDPSIASLPPGDVKLTNAIVSHVKSQGLFDQIRRDCLADVDTKPAYQNLKQRVEGYVSNFLQAQVWRSDLNKNQLRDTLRRHINGSGMLAIGVDRIVEQVVNPKVNRVFYPQIESTVFKLLDKEPPPNSVTALAMAQKMAAASNEANLANQQETSISPPGTSDVQPVYSKDVDMNTAVPASSDPVLPTVQPDNFSMSASCNIERDWTNYHETGEEATTPPEVMSPPPKSMADTDSRDTTSSTSFIREIEEEIRLGQCESVAKDAILSPSDSESHSIDITGKGLTDAVRLTPVKCEIPDTTKDDGIEKQENNKSIVNKQKEKSKSENTKKTEMKSETKSKITEKQVKPESMEGKVKITEKIIKQDSSEHKSKAADKLAKQDSSETKPKVSEKAAKQEGSNKSGKNDSGDQKKVKLSKSEHEKSFNEKDKKFSAPQGSKMAKPHDGKGKNSESGKQKTSEKIKTDHSSSHKKTENSKSLESTKTKSSDHKSKSDDSSRDSSKSGLKSPTSKLKHSGSHSSSPDKTESKAKSAEKHKSDSSKSTKCKDDAKVQGSEKVKVHDDKNKSEKTSDEGKAKIDKLKVEDSRSKSVERSKVQGHEKSAKTAADKVKPRESHKPKDIKERSKSDSSKDKKGEVAKSSSDHSSKSHEGSKASDKAKAGEKPIHGGVETPKRKDSTDKHMSRSSSAKHKGDSDKQGSRPGSNKPKDFDSQISRPDSFKRKDESDKHASRSEDSKHKNIGEKHGSRVEVSKHSDDTDKHGEKSKQKEDKVKPTDLVKSKSVEKNSDKMKHDSKLKSSDLSKISKDSLDGKTELPDIKKRKNSDASKPRRVSVDKDGGKAKGGDEKAKVHEKDKRSKSPAYDKHVEKKKSEKSPISAKTPEMVKKLPDTNIKEGTSGIKHHGEKHEPGLLMSTSREKLKRKLSMEGISPLKKLKVEPEDEVPTAAAPSTETEMLATDCTVTFKEESAREEEPVPPVASGQDGQHITLRLEEEDGHMSDLTVSSVHTSDLSDYDDRISLTDTEGNEDRRLSSPEKAAKKPFSPEKIKPLTAKGRGRPKKARAPRGRKGSAASSSRDLSTKTHETPPSEKESPQSVSNEVTGQVKAGDSEPRRELRRQRKINPRYTSDEFASIFTKGRDKLHLGDSDESHHDDEKDQRSKSYDELRPPAKVSESAKEESEKGHRGKKTHAPVNSEQSPVPDAEIPYSPRSDASEADIIRSYRRPSKDRDSGARTLSPKSDISADSYSHLQGSQTPESTCSTEGKRRLPSAKHYETADLYKPRPPNRGGRRNRPFDHQRYDDSDLYKPRPVITASSRRCRGSSPPLTPELPSNTRRSRITSVVSPEDKPGVSSAAPHEADVDIEKESEPSGRKRKRSISSSGEESFVAKGKKDNVDASDNDEIASPERRTHSESSETEPHQLFERPAATRGRRRLSTDQNISQGRGRPLKDRSRRGRR